MKKLLDPRNLKIGTLLSVGIVIIITLMISASFYSTFLSNRGLTIIRNSTTRIFDVLTIQRDIEELFSALDGLEIVLDEERLRIEENKIASLQKKAEQTIQSSTEKNIFNKQESAEAILILNEVTDLSERIVESRRLAIQKNAGSREPDKDLNKEELTGPESLFNNLRNIRFQMLAIFNEMTIRSDEEFREAMDLVRRAQSITWIVIGISLGLAILLGFFLVRSVKKIFDLKNEFVNIIAHDLRNPVTAIIGYLDIITSNKNKKISELHEDFQVLNVSTQKLRSQISNLLEVGRTEAGRVKLNLEAVQPFEVIEESMLRAKALAEISGIQIVYKKVETKDVHVQADRSKLSDVLDNLISNAIKYNREKGTVTISTNISEDELSILVADTGQGIPENQKDKIFKKYSRLNTDKEKRVGGTGLGLYTVKLAMVSMNGKVEFETKKNEGATFKITLKKVYKNGKT